jgi:3-ketosteroid 9alpha-monooxygenase subunit B
LTDAVQLRVVEVVEETGDAKSFVFEAPGPMPYKPGQFLTVAVPSDQTGVAARCYSLSSAPHESDLLKVTVKRTVDGYASNWLCDNVQAGQTVTALPPSGIFTPASLDADFLMYAAGSGITPVVSIIKSALAEGNGRVVLLYANRDESSVIFAPELKELADKYAERFVFVHWLESLQGLPTPTAFKLFAANFPTYDAFVCGPAPFMAGVVDALKELGFPRERRHQEKFVSLGGNPFGDTLVSIGDPGAEADAPLRSGPARVSGDLDGVAFEFDDWPADRPLLDFLLEKGIQAPYSCRLGECSACACRVIEGEVSMKNNDVLDRDDLADGIRLVCQSLPVSDELKITYSG